MLRRGEGKRTLRNPMPCHVAMENKLPWITGSKKPLPPQLRLLSTEERELSNHLTRRADGNRGEVTTRLPTSRRSQPPSNPCPKARSWHCSRRPHTTLDQDPPPYPRRQPLHAMHPELPVWFPTRRARAPPQRGPHLRDRPCEVHPFPSPLLQRRRHTSQQKGARKPPIPLHLQHGLQAYRPFSQPALHSHASSQPTQDSSVVSSYCIHPPFLTQLVTYPATQGTQDHGEARHHACAWQR